MTVDGDTLLKIVMATFTIGSAIFSWVATRDKATQSEIAELKQTVLKLETDMAHVPDKDTLHRLELGMQEMAGKVENMGRNFETVTNSIRRLEEYLLNVQAVTAIEERRSPPSRRSRK